LGALAEATPDFEGIRRFMEKLDVGATGLQRHVFLRQIGAESFATSGYAEPAIEMVRRGVSAGLTDLMWLDRCPALDSIRADARFAEARAEVEARVRPAWTLVQS
jgi:hypothetical protein